MTGTICKFCTYYRPSSGECEVTKLKVTGETKCVTNDKPFGRWLNGD